MTLKRGDPIMPNVSSMALVKYATGTDQGETAERMLAELEAKAREFAGPDPSPAMLDLGQVAAQDLFLWHLLQFRHATVEGSGPRDWVDARLERVNKRLCRTLRTLAQLRRLSQPDPRADGRAIFAQLFAGMLPTRADATDNGTTPDADSRPGNVG